METKNVSIIGGGSISAAFLLKLLSHHKNVSVKNVFSASQAGKKVSDYHSILIGMAGMEFKRPDNKALIEDSDIVFITRQHGEHIDDTAKLVNDAKALGREIKFIDLSADFRLKDTSLYSKWYGVKHNHKDIIDSAVYGLTELYLDEIKGASFVANPGCYPTCAILSLAPLLSGGIGDADGIVINALSGISGAGIRPSAKNIAMHVSENIFAYKVGGVHQHTPEMEQELSRLSGGDVKVTFVPHVAPFKYGIIETIYVTLKDETDEKSVHGSYSDFYSDSKFVNVLSLGDFPEIKDVVGTNFVNIGLKIDPRTNTLIIVSCIDNIIKGASGQAVQNMNVMCGFDESEGLL